MRIFEYVDPDENGCPLVHHVTEDEIIEEYWSYWAPRMRAKGLEPTSERCIEDWCIVHWAHEIEAR